MPTFASRIAFVVPFVVPFAVPFSIAFAVPFAVPFVVPFAFPLVVPFVILDSVSSKCSITTCASVPIDPNVPATCVLVCYNEVAFPPE